MAYIYCVACRFDTKISSAHQNAYFIINGTSLCHEHVKQWEDGQLVFENSADILKALKKRGE